ncbi:pre-rRNA-processing protein TSR1 homolog [Agrilus planipennis]|uniref:Pre-rRNA-processing protein TSR1 homolog n=1 Tax=Agrilus planipennis TaxID=224129 RepID=A0A1W4XNG4_AGRPL|nr:pre-rRNA-processing protein TSR1 homolog [Agrilus planipennis]
MAIQKEVHRSGLLKQTNKPHKHGKHRSKGAVNEASQGKISIKTLSKKHKKELNKEQRRHQTQQIRRNKRNEILAKKRQLGIYSQAPFLVCVIPLNKQLDLTTALLLLNNCDEENIINKSPSGITHLSVPKFKQRFAFIQPPTDNEFATLDTLKVCNTVLFVISAASETVFNSEYIDQWGNKLLLSAFAQGLPTPTVVVTDLDSIAPKKRNEQKQAIQKLVSKWFPDEKIMNLGKNVDALNVLRKIGNQKQKNLTYRDRRTHLVAEKMEFVPEDDHTGTLKLTGYLRGTPLSANDLVHIIGIGDYQISQIEAPADPFIITKEKNPDNIKGKHVQTTFLERADPNKQTLLDSENIPDPMDAEQSWPTEEEFKNAEKEAKIKKVKKVPKGWSDYQAAWIPDEDAEMVEDSESDDEFKCTQYMCAMSEGGSDYSDTEDNMDNVTESEVAVNDQQYDKDMDMDEEKKEFETIKQAKIDRMFPDEVDTPQDIPARVRFQKYRGLESFRTSSWDPKENLPYDYGRIFQFQSFERTRKRIIKELENKDGALPGWYITVHVSKVRKEFWLSVTESRIPPILFGLLPHERKMTVVNVVLKRTSTFDKPIASKETLIFQCGCRRFTVNPIFSQHTNGNKHKFERFFQPELTVVATFFAPICFPPAPVLCFKEIDGTHVLVAQGSVLNCDPDRLIIKRVVLTGHPLKVHKRSAVVRFMFFNREDIIYFKPVKLRTKYGRTGHIKEPLGTHGHMKCIFDGQLKSMDTILMNLYKRVFPKYTYQELLCTTKNDEDITDLPN